MYIYMYIFIYSIQFDDSIEFVESIQVHDSNQLIGEEAIRRAADAKSVYRIVCAARYTMMCGDLTGSN